MSQGVHPSSDGVATSNGCTKIHTSKHWVLPPRPKPGRKPGKKSSTATRLKLMTAKNDSEMATTNARQSMSPAESTMESDSGYPGLSDSQQDRGTPSNTTSSSVNTPMDSTNGREPDLRYVSISPDIAGEDAWQGFKDLEMDDDDEDKQKDVAYLNWAIGNLKPKKAVPLRSRHSQETNNDITMQTNENEQYQETIDGLRAFRRSKLTTKTISAPTLNEIDEITYSTQTLQLPKEAYEMSIPKKPWGDSCGFCSNGTPCVCYENRDDYQEK